MIKTLYVDTDQEMVHLVRKDINSALQNNFDFIAFNQVKSVEDYLENNKADLIILSTRDSADNIHGCDFEINEIICNLRDGKYGHEMKSVPVILYSKIPYIFVGVSEKDCGLNVAVSKRGSRMSLLLAIQGLLVSRLI